MLISFGYSLHLTITVILRQNNFLLTFIMIFTFISIYFKHLFYIYLNGYIREYERYTHVFSLFFRGIRKLMKK